MRLVFGLVFLLTAATLRPEFAPKTTASIVWTPQLAEGVLLGRRFAAADLGWMSLVQTLGAPDAERAGYPTVVAQVDTITELDPHFIFAYYYGAILVLTDPDRATHLMKVLERGRATFPQDHEFPRLMGFLEHFGRLNLAEAAKHYREAVALGGPSYLEALATRLATSDLQCRDLRNELAGIARTAQRDEQRILMQRSAAIIGNCEKTRLEAAAAQYRFNKGVDATLADLIASGQDPPLAPPGECWVIEGVRAIRRPCP